MRHPPWRRQRSRRTPIAQQKVLPPMVVSLYSRLQQYPQAAATIQQLNDKQARPDEQYLAFQLDAYTHAGDQPDVSKVLDELVTYYPKPDYWLQALQPLLKMDNEDTHLQLNVYRLMDEVGARLRPPPDSNRTLLVPSVTGNGRIFQSALTCRRPGGEIQ